MFLTSPLIEQAFTLIDPGQLKGGVLSVMGILQQLLQHQSPRANKRLEPELALLRKFKEWMASCESFVEYSYEVAAIK